ncbi:MAG: sigma-70 family RNA polymerase sigma factor [Verrucomicrobiota bacterium]
MAAVKKKTPKKTPAKATKKASSKKAAPATKKKASAAAKTKASGAGAKKKAAAPAKKKEASAANGSTAKPKAGGKRGRAKKEDSGGFLKTRKSLIERLDNWEDRQGWNEFYQIYSQFLFRVARKAGLSDQEANEAVQETFIGVAKNLSKKKFNVNGGSFKAWLMNQARWRIVDQFRGRKPESAFNRPGLPPGEYGDRRTATLERFADPAGEKLERIWDLEWKESITELALKSLRSKVSPEQYQIFYLYVVKGWATNKVRDHLGVTATQVYLAKHRVGRLMKKEVERLEQQTI